MANSGHSKRRHTGESKCHRREKHQQRSSSSLRSHSELRQGADISVARSTGGELLQAGEPSTPPPPVRPGAAPFVPNSSSPSRVHGASLVTSSSEWPELVSENAILVDKSLAIKRVMECGAIALVAIAPRRSGKSTFLTMMTEFLSAHSTWTADYRMKSFKGYNLCEQHPQFVKDNFAKYPVLHFDLSSNKYLKLGLMVGVFHIPLAAAGSGLNNLKVYQAHTGAWAADSDGNPFDTAFNLTAADVKGLVDRHVSNYASSSDDLAAQAQLRKNLVLFCFKNFDGYRYGAQRFIFNMYCVVMFLGEIKSRASLSLLPHAKTSYWTETGSMAMFWSMHTASSQSFIGYAAALAREFAMRYACQYGEQPVAGVILDALQKADIDSDLDAIESLEGTELSIGIDAVLLDDVATMCKRESHGDAMLEWSSNGHPVDSVFRQLYQAGYLTQLSATRVGIPNPEVFRVFTTFANTIYGKSKLPGQFRDNTLKRLGIGHGNVFEFARYLDEATSQLPSAITGKTLEVAYHANMSFLLAPLIGRGGFAIEHEVPSEGGYLDIRLLPLPSNTSTEKPYIIFELKKLDYGAGQSLQAVMAKEKLELANDKARASSMEAMKQIRRRYGRANLSHAVGSTVVLQIAVTFWRYRFYLVARRLGPKSKGRDSTEWEKEPFAKDKIQEQGTANVKFTVKKGWLHASNICK
ncbi:hypothetical protein GGI20_004217 [Coemansia sp. BCRC 34301]|nr:hypothetical protein GGI20_004217 [Coemansia sp. BCRC 34301]